MLAKQLSQCNALRKSTGLLGTLVALVCEALALSRHTLSALTIARAMCSAVAAVDAAAAMPPRQAAAAGAKPRHARPCEPDRVHAAACHTPAAHSDPSLHFTACRHAPACDQQLARAAGPRRQAPRPAVAVGSKGPLYLRATFGWRRANLYIPCRVAACRRACGPLNLNPPWHHGSPPPARNMRRARGARLDTSHRPPHRLWHARGTIWFVPSTLHDRGRWSAGALLSAPARTIVLVAQAAADNAAAAAKSALPTPRRAAEPPSDRWTHGACAIASPCHRAVWAASCTAGLGRAGNVGAIAIGAWRWSCSTDCAGASCVLGPGTPPDHHACARRHDGAVRCRPVQVRQQRPVQRAGLLHERGLRRLRDGGEPCYQRHAAA
jgi:hypothetical protein